MIKNIQNTVFALITTTVFAFSYTFAQSVLETKKMDFIGNISIKVYCTFADFVPGADNKACNTNILVVDKSENAETKGSVLTENKAKQINNVIATSVNTKNAQVVYVSGRDGKDGRNGTTTIVYQTTIGGAAVGPTAYIYAGGNTNSNPYQTTVPGDIYSTFIHFLTSEKITTGDITGQNAYLANVTATNTFSTNLVSVNSTTTNLFAQNASLTNATSTYIYSLFANLVNLLSQNATLTNATTTNFVATNAALLNATTTNLIGTFATLTNATITNLFVNLLRVFDLFFNNATGTNLAITNVTSTGTFAFATGTIASTTINNLFGTTASITNATNTNLFSENASFTNSTSTNLFSVKASITEATTTHLFATWANFLNLFVQNLSFTSATGTNLQVANASTTNLTATGTTIISNLYGNLATFTAATTTNLFVNLLRVFDLFFNNATGTNLSITNVTSTGTFAFATGTIASTTINNLFGTTASITNATNTNLFSENASITNSTSTNSFAAMLNAISAFITNLTATNATLTNATSTNLVATNTSTSNLLGTNATLTNATTTNLFATLFNALTAAFTNLTATNATVSNATSSNFATTNLTATGTTNLGITYITQDQSGPVPYQLVVGGKTDTNKQLLVGYNTTNDYGSIQAVNQGISYSNLILNRNGGNVGVGTDTPSQALSVNGNALISGDVFASGITSVNATLTNATSTNLFATLFNTLNAKIDGLVSINATITNATTTNLFSSLANFTSLLFTNLTGTNATITNATTTNFASNGIFALATGTVASTSILNANIANLYAENFATFTKTLVENIARATTSNEISFATSTNILTSIVNGKISTTSLITLVNPSAGSNANAVLGSGFSSDSTTLAPVSDLSFTVGANEVWYISATGTISGANAVNSGASVRFLSSGGLGSCNFRAIELVTSTASASADCSKVDINTSGGTVAFNVSGVLSTRGGGTVTLNFGRRLGGISAPVTLDAGAKVVAYKLGGADLAEVYYTADNTVEEGDVVALDGTGISQVAKSNKRYQKNVLGIISTKPGMVIGEADGTGKAVIVGLSGRVPVKVTDENGKVKAGDFLTAGSVAGKAMKATGSGQVIGQALTDDDGSGKIYVFIKNTYSDGTTADDTELTIADKFTALIKTTFEKLSDVYLNMTLAISTLKANDVKANKVTVQQLCVGQACFTESEMLEFRNYLDTKAVIKKVDISEAIPEIVPVDVPTSPVTEPVTPNEKSEKVIVVEPAVVVPVTEVTN